MPKNLTLSIPDELANKMDKFGEVNWSAVAREGIEVYVKRRSDPAVVATLERLGKERDALYESGRQSAQGLVRRLKYPQLETVFDSMGKTHQDLKHNMELWDFYFGGIPQVCLAEKDSPAFFKGFHDALTELKEKLAD